MHWIALSRPHFLLGGALLYGMGALAAGVTDPASYLLGQLAVTASQLTAHLVNEYADLEPDRLVVNRTWFSGGSGVLVEGAIAPRSALMAAVATTVVSVSAAIAVGITHPGAGFLAVATLLVSWGYSMPPTRLLSTGWGELATSLVVVVAVPLIGAMSQGGGIPQTLMWAMASLLPLHMAMMLAFEIPDIESDRQAGKRVLAVRIGRRPTRLLMIGLLVVGFAIAAAGATVANPSLAWILVGIPASLIAIGGDLLDRHGLLTAAAVATLVVSTLGAIESVIR